MRSGFIFIASLLVFLSCKNKDQKKEEPASRYKNHILLEAKGFKIKDAFLAFNDSTKLSDDNKVNIGQHVNLILLIDSGWTVENGRIYPGVGQKIESSDGKHVFEQKDLMESHPEGVPAEDGFQVTIQAIIKSSDKDYDHFLVSFHVWDKKNDHEITGSYKLHVKP
jgi:hypothetical protein